ncbi:hypothetical protein AYR46_02970 [Sphingobium yanoikuyae]|uniref:phage tail tape measure protein n=1 Tax=Sphingobium yanoikuyae TaxID=13690 RepID=UPI0007A7572C|nr:phage tail tape measure protein [Sphingobium yanoikuyae]KZC82883.1 hypothetical protein AYR46_02970 [Sphingobium yanoikuyae]
MPSSVIGQLRVILGLDTAAFEKGLTDAEREMSRSTRKLEKMGQRMEGLGKSISVGVTLPILAVGGAALGMAAKFESAMNRVEAATGATGKQLAALKQQAIDFGKSKDFTATAAESADVMEMLAKNGLNVQQILGGATKATLQFAAANGAEFAPSADAVTDILQQFGRDVSELPGIVDKMTGAMLVSKMGFDDYRLAIGQAGGVAGGTGQSFEDMNVVLAATSSLFASGSDAGTSYKTFLTSLPGKSKEAKSAIESYGLSFYDAQGNMKSMGEIAQNLQDKLGGLSDQAKSEVLTTIFGTDAMRTAIGLMNQGADGLARISTEINKASAQTQMEARMKGWSGAITQVKKAFEAAAISLGDSGILSALTKVLTMVAATIGAFADLPQPIQLVIGSILGLTATVGPLLITGGKMIAMWAGITTMLVGRFIPASAAAAIAATSTGTAAAGAAVGFTALRTAISFLLPWAAVIGGVALALYGMSRASAQAAADANKLANEQSAANKFQAEYQAIMARDNSAGVAAGVNGLADAHKRAADEAFRHAQAELAVRKAAIIQTARDARSGYRTETRTRYEAVPGSRERRAVQYSERVALSTRRGGRGGDNTGRSEQDRALDAARADWRAVYQQEQDLIAAHKQVLTSPAAKAAGGGATPVAANDNSGGGKGGKGNSGPTKEELADRREELRLQAEMTAAQMRGDSGTVQRLQDQIDLKRQIKDYEDAGLTAVEAKKAAESDLATIAAARRVAAQRDIADQKASVELDMARLANDDERALQLEREQEIKDTILFFEQQLVDITDQKLRLEQATTMAMEQQAKVDAARAAGRAKWLAQDEAQRQIDLMKARGETEETIRQAQRRYDIERRIEQLKAQGITEGVARSQAEAEDSQMELARQQGEWRDTIKGAARAALDGDLKGFASNWWKDVAARGMEQGLNSISDLLFSLFKQAFGQGASSLGGGGNSGGIFGSIAKGLGTILGGGKSSASSTPVINQNAIANAFPKLQGFANGTDGWMKPVGGMAGVDNNVVAFRMSSNEEFAVRRKGEIGAPVGGGTTNNYYGPGAEEFWGTINGIASGNASSAVNESNRRRDRRAARRMGR